MQQGDVTSGIGGEGSWTNPKGCTKENEFLIGYRFKAEVSAHIKDNWFGENLDVQCEGNEVLKGEDFTLENGNWATGGQWSSIKKCPARSAICGIETKIYRKQSFGKDDVGLTDIRFNCCNF